MYYYTWEDEEGTKVLGECLTPGCDNIDYCYDETEEDIKKRYGNRLKAPKFKYIEFVKSY